MREATTVSMSRCVGDALSIVPTTASELCASGRQEVDAELSATKKTKNKKKKKKEALKEDQTSVAEAAPPGGKRKKEDKEPAPAAATKKKQKKQMTVEAPFVSAACAPVSDEPKSPAARLAKLERRLKKACRSGDKTAEASLKTRIEKLRRKAQKQHDQPSSPS